MAAGGVSKSKFNDFSSKEGMNGPGNKQKMLTSKDLLRWFTDSGCLSKGAGKQNTSNNLDIAFSSTKGKLPGLFSDKIDALVKNVAKAYAKDNKCSEDEAVAAITGKLNGGEKAAHGTTKTAKNESVGKMTDTSKYTGAHKERFDADGKGKGAEGREDKAENTGYVGAYKGAGTKK